MYKILIHISLIIMTLSIIYTLVFFTNQSNTITIEPSEYPEVLETVHNNLDQYLGKKFIISGYVYTQADFSENRFVIAQNTYLESIPSAEPVIIGFLCENKSDTNIIPNEDIKIEGILSKCIYNNSTYPILLVNKIKSI